MEGLFFHFLFAFAIYPVKKTYWKTILTHGTGWAFGWAYYPVLVVGWAIIPLWFFLGTWWAGSLGLFREDIPEAYGALGFIYFMVWIVIIIWFSGKAWFDSEKTDKELESKTLEELAVLAERNDTFAESLGKKEYICSILNARFVLIPAGTFMMGSPEDEPDSADDETLHQVTISEPFYMQTTPMTQGQWLKVMGNNPSEFSSCGDDCPVERVSWNDVQEFVGKLNSMDGTDKYRLPTEAEWEYACRAGSTTAYCFGDDPGGLGEYAWYADNSEDMTHPVGRKKPNAWGLYDMHGNVWEWVQDRQGDYPAGSVTDPEGPSSGSDRVGRGGSWDVGGDAGFCRSAARVGFDPDDRYCGLGFRLLRTR